MTPPHTKLDTPRQLGRSGLSVGRLGFGSSYGGSAAGYEKAFERGCNYFYWGSMQRKGMGDAIRHLAPQNRENLVVVIQSYSRLATLMRRTLVKSVKTLKLDHADVLLLGWYNKMPSERIMDEAMALKEKGLVRAIAISCHHRPSFQKYIQDQRIDIIMTRYNAAHRGAEREVFPFLDAAGARPGVVSYTTTRWGYLVNPKYTPQGLPTPSATDCYRFALSNSNIDVCLSGPSNDAQLEENIKALERGPLSEDEMVWMKKVGDHVHKMTSRKWYANPFMQRTP